MFAHRRSRDPLDYAASLLRATNTEVLLVDDGFPPPAISVNWDELGTVAGCRAAPVMRIETLPEVHVTVVGRARGGLRRAQDDRGLPRRAGAISSDAVLVALEANAATGDPLPVQVHTGFGDADLSLPLSRPGLLKPLIERYDTTPFVLLHCYPFVREAGWLAHVYANVFFDLSLTIPHVAQPEQALREALELAPLSKLLYASDAARTPELYFLGATWWRDALAVVLSELGEGETAARMILRENAFSLYRLSA